jgi:hypothetical protein
MFSKPSAQAFRTGLVVLESTWKHLMSSHFFGFGSLPIAEESIIDYPDYLDQIGVHLDRHFFNLTSEGFSKCSCLFWSILAR